MNGAIVEARPQHCGRIARSLRGAHRKILLDIKVNPHRELRDSFNASSWRRSLVVDGVLVATGGVTGTVASSTGAIWLALSEEARKYPVLVARLALRMVEEIMLTKRQLTTIVLKEDRDSVRFAYFMGFRVKEPTSVHGADALVMVLDRKGTT